MLHNKLSKTIEHTKSVCPQCLKIVEAKITTRDGSVFMEKNCSEHGNYTANIWPEVEHYLWLNSFKLPAIRPHSSIPSVSGCPDDCGLCKAHFRQPTLVEIEVTDRCNLCCPVCFMAAEEFKKTIAPDPDLNSITEKYRYILQNTNTETSIQLTGGEPTVRKDLPEIVRIGREIGFQAIEVNTNGVVIGQNPEYIKKLAKVGISGIYLQFDGLTNDIYQLIRGENLLDVKLQAIENCRQAGVQVVLAMTVIDGINDGQMGDVLNFALENQDVIVGIAYQPAFGSGRFEVSPKRRLTMGDVIFMLAEQSQGLIEPYDFWPLGCSHPLCSTSTHLVKNQGEYTPITRLLTPEEYVDSFSPNSPQGSVFADIVFDKFPEIDLGLTILIENYIDAMNMDLNKLRECSMIVAGKDGGLIPFCGYQLTNIDGKKKNEL
ncbi:MAG TPA: radical SAM protein [Syntrophomonadaceae bacterium]|nr:radical SAM protein [Syntrophomonadaceae bacterium]